MHHFAGGFLASAAGRQGPKAGRGAEGFASEARLFVSLGPVPQGGGPGARPHCLERAPAAQSLLLHQTQQTAL
jgi:hypothetical protein